MDFGGTRDCISCYIRACLSSLTQGNLPDGAKGGAAPHRYEMWLLQRVAGCTSGACRGVSACLSCHGHAANTGIVGGPRGDLARPSRLHTAGFLHRVRCAPSRWSSASLPCFLLFHVPCNSRPSWRRNRCRLLIFPPPLTVRVLAHFSLWPQAPLPGQHRGLRRAVLVPAREDELCSFCLSCCRFGEDGNDDARRLIRLGACPAEKLSQLMAENRCPRR